MADDKWREVRVEDIKSTESNALATGPFGSSISSKFFQEHGIPVIRGSNLSELIGTRLIDANLVFVSEKKAQEFRRSTVKRDDLIFTCWGTITQVGLIDERSRYDRYVISNKQMKLTPDPAIGDSLFLYYMFSGPEMQQRISSQGIGSSVPGFNLGQLRNFELILPPLYEQQAIASVLGALDDKIELNRCMNETLEAMARAIFKSWFVDFDPVRAKAEGRQPYGMDVETAALFPDSFEDSSLGKIPIGWQVGKLSDLCTTQYGYTASAASEEIGPHFLRVMDINKRNWIEWSSVPYCAIREDDKAKYALHEGDLLVARMADPGKSAIIDRPVDAVFASYLVRLKSQSLAHAYYVYGFLKSQLYAEYSAAVVGGSVQKNMNAKVIVDADLVLPSNPILDKFFESILPFRRRLVANVDESQTLAAIRDTLLPKLMSGEVRVKDAERIMERLDT